jgi:alpha-glucosidase (family GH31 glycosyl hydrolase)
MNRVQDWARKGNELVLRLDEGQIALSFAEPDVLRIRATNQPGFKGEETFVVCKKVQGQAFTVSEVENGLWLKTSELSVNVTLPCFGLLVCDLQGNPVFSTPARRALDLGEQRAERVVFRCVLAPDERIYGLGQDPMAHLDQRDAERRMWHEWGGHRRSGNAGMPFMLSSRGYGLLLNSSWPARFAVGRAKVAEPPFQPGWAPAPWPWNENSGETHPDETAVLLDDSELDLFLICRSSLDAIHRGYMELTGYPPLPPKWALGFMQCKNRYRSQAELLSVAHEYRRRGIPCDVLVIDWLWFKEFGDLEWAKAAWPDPPGMLQELAEMGFHVLQYLLNLYFRSRVFRGLVQMMMLASRRESSAYETWPSLNPVTAWNWGLVISASVVCTTSVRRMTAITILYLDSAPNDAKARR